MEKSEKKPWWLILIIIVLMLPIFAFPTLLSLVPPDMEGARMIIWFYVIYVLGTGWLAWICWPERKLMTWIMLILLVLSHIAIWTLVLYRP